jgi:hypothetical protein
MLGGHLVFVTLHGWFTIMNEARQIKLMTLNTMFSTLILVFSITFYLDLHTTMIVS